MRKKLVVPVLRLSWAGVLAADAIPELLAYARRILPEHEQEGIEGLEISAEQEPDLPAHEIADALADDVDNYNAGMRRTITTYGDGWRFSRAVDEEPDLVDMLSDVGEYTPSGDA
jgi:hypothetical protein